MSGTLIRTKYAVGDVFFRPLSRKRNKEVAVQVDGVEYKRYEDYLSPEVEELVVMQVEAIVDGIEPADITYRCKMKNDTVPYFSVNGADNEGFTYSWNRAWKSEELALCARDYGHAKEIANDYAIHKKREFSPK